MKTAIAWILTLLLTGCASTEQLNSIRTFSSAAHDFSTSANDAFVKLNGSFVDRNISSVASGDDAVADSTFVGVLDNSAGFLQTTAALHALGAYADALGTLANANYGPDIDKAATSLYGALSAVDKDAVKLDGSVPRITDADLGVLATLVKAIGDIAAREKQAAAITKAVTLAEPAVQAICKGIGKELADVASVYATNLDTLYTNDFRAYQREQGPLSYSSRTTRLQQLRITKVARLNADQFLLKLSDSAQSLATAHTRIDQLVNGSKITPADVVRAVGELKAYADELKTFNSNLTKGTP